MAMIYNALPPGGLADSRRKREQTLSFQYFEKTVSIGTVEGTELVVSMFRTWDIICETQKSEFMLTER